VAAARLQADGANRRYAWFVYRNKEKAMRPASFGSRAHLQAKRSAKAAVVALHCSGSSGRQWDALAGALGDHYCVIAPDLYGSGSQRPWPGERPFRLSDEAAPIIDMIDRQDGPVHLVGHSYGGAVALRAALARPSRVASLSLFEPMVPHVLKTMGPDGFAAQQEISGLLRNLDAAIVEGAHRWAAECFVDYFNGIGRWAAMKPDAQMAFMRYLPKAAIESRAVMEERVPLMAYTRLRMPALLMHGGATTQPTELITRKLAEVLKTSVWHVLDGAGHMAPITWAQQVNAFIGDHIRRVDGLIADDRKVPPPAWAAA
jgi:pimeloyl-ACP methyl ester carboxylesterase